MRNKLSSIRHYEMDLIQFLDISEFDAQSNTTDAISRTISEAYRAALVRSRYSLLLPLVMGWATEVDGRALDALPYIRAAFDLVRKERLSDAAHELHKAAYLLIHKADLSRVSLQDLAILSELYLELIHLAALMTACRMNDYWAGFSDCVDLDRVRDIARGSRDMSSLKKKLADVCDWMDEALGSSVYPGSDIDAPLPVIIVCWAASHGHLEAICESIRSHLASKREPAGNVVNIREGAKTLN